MTAIGDLLEDLDRVLDNTYMDSLTRVWLTRVVNTLEAEGWTKTKQQEPKRAPLKFEPGPEQMTFLSGDEDTSPSTSSKGTTKPTPTDPSETVIPSEG